MNKSDLQNLTEAYDNIDQMNAIFHEAEKFLRTLEIIKGIGVHNLPTALKRRLPYIKSEIDSILSEE